MKKLSLICLNENADIVSVEIFTSLESARIAMANAVDREKKDAKVSGFKPNVSLGFRKSYVGYGESEYTWSIVDCEEKTYAEETEEYLNYYEGKLKELGYTTTRHKNQYHIEYSNGEKTAIFSLCYQGDFMIAWKKNELVSYNTSQNNIYKYGTKLTRKICDKGFEKPAWIK